MTLRVFEIITDVKYGSETRHHCCTNLGLKTIRTVMIETNAPKRPLPMYTLTDSQYTGGSTA